MTSAAERIPDPGDLHPAVAAALGAPDRFVTPRGARVVRATYRGRPVLFVINNRQDRIHKTQLRGLFYEQDQLERMAEHMPPGGVFCDIGANIGNHSLYMALFGGAGRVIPMEPNPKAIQLLVAAAVLNGVTDRVAVETLGYGIGDSDAEGYGIDAPKRNLGWARLAEGAGDIPLRRGDTILADEPRVDFIKIDVEGMEIAALSGLRATLARCRPKLFVEVDHTNRPAFDALVARLGYRVLHSAEPTRINQNLLLGPVLGPGGA